MLIANMATSLDASVCGSCQIGINLSENIVSCGFCSTIFHHKCSKLNELYFKALNEANYFFWKCFSCRIVKHSLNNMADDIKYLKTELVALKNIVGSSKTKPLTKGSKRVSFAEAVTPAASHVSDLRESPRACESTAPVVASADALSSPAPETLDYDKNILCANTNGSCADGFTVVTSKKNKRKRVKPVVGNNSEAGSNLLVGVPRRVNIFVGRVALGTSPGDILKFLAVKFPENDFTCEQFRSNDAQCSFKLNIPSTLRNEVLNCSLWPSDIIVGNFYPPRKPPNAPNVSETTVMSPNTFTVPCQDVPVDSNSSGTGTRRPVVANNKSTL
ncbi:uncharacterized protein LOC124158428 [Ischnura elegans]|uniref:uncharacterized protein LOC124158428 n=1 Tax=Ischnura elegans TaxID=197161 RepID=UPI001ED8BE06|nr:uncharacterized protein LOC124158428 [Ischnura elegans]